MLLLPECGISIERLVLIITNEDGEQMFNKVCGYIEANKMLVYGDKVVVGLSGGADSVCLLHMLCRLRERYGLTLYAVHINHGIRGEEARGDAGFCEGLAREYGIMYRCAEYNIPVLAREWKVTEEEAGRIVRYREFDNEVSLRGADRVAVAHHLNDQAETILFRMCRGTGIKGMTGIPCSRDRIIRPLLCLSKPQILEYLVENNISYREDSTNSCVEYDRNRLRGNVIPELEKINSMAVPHIGELAKQLADIYAWYDDSVRSYYKKNVTKSRDAVSVDAEFIKNIHEAAAREIIRRMIGSMTNSLKDIERRHIDMIYALADAETGKSVDLPYSLIACNEYGRLRISLFTKGESGNTMMGEVCRCVEYTDGKCIWENVYLPDEKKLCPLISISNTRTEYKNSGGIIPKNSCTKWFDYDRISSKIIIRKPEAQDYICIGEGKNKKLTRYIIDSKIPRRYRDNLLVMAAGNRVLWIIGGRGSVDCYVTEDTEHVLQMNADCLD